MQNIFLVSFFFLSFTLAREYIGVAKLRPGKRTLIAQECVDSDEWIMRNYTKLAVNLEWYVTPSTFVRHAFDKKTNHHLTFKYEAIGIPWIKFINPNSTKNTHFLKNNTLKLVQHNISDCVDLFAVTNGDQTVTIYLHYVFGVYWLT